MFDHLLPANEQTCPLAARLHLLIEVLVTLALSSSGQCLVASPSFLGSPAGARLRASWATSRLMLRSWWEHDGPITNHHLPDRTSGIALPNGPHFSPARCRVAPFLKTNDLYLACFLQTCPWVKRTAEKRAVHETCLL